MTRAGKRTTVAGAASIAVLLSAASVLAQGAGAPMPRRDDDRGAPQRAVERRVIRHDDFVPPPPQPQGDRVIERRSAPRGMQVEGRELGLGERFEQRIRALEERVQALAEHLKMKLREHGQAMSRGGNQPGDAPQVMLERLHEGALKHLIELHLSGDDHPGKPGAHSQGAPRLAPHGLAGGRAHDDDDNDDDDDDDARPSRGAGHGGQPHVFRLGQPMEREIQIQRQGGPENVRGFRVAPPGQGPAQPPRARWTTDDNRGDGHDGPHFIGLNKSGTWQIEIKSPDGQGTFHGQIERSPGPDGPRGRGQHNGPGGDEHEIIIELRDDDGGHGGPGPRGGDGPVKVRGFKLDQDGPVTVRGFKLDQDGPGDGRRAVEKHIIIDDRDDDNGPGDGPKPRQQRKTIRLDGAPRGEWREGEPHVIILEDDSDHAAPPAPHTPPRPPTAPRAPRPPAGRGVEPSSNERAPLPARERAPRPNSLNVAPSIAQAESDWSSNYTLASLVVPPEEGAQPTPKARTAVKAKAGAAPEAKGDGKSEKAVTTIIEDDDAVTVRMENGKVASVERNGKKVPMDRVLQEDGKLKITDDDGKVVYEMKLNVTPSPTPPAGAPAASRERKALRLTAPGKPPEPPAAPTAPGEVWIRGNKIENVPGGMTGITVADQPKVIVGIQMADPDRSLIGHFGLKPGEVTMISGVYEDLPASKAGLDLYDIIVSVDGKSPAGQDDVRKSLRSKKEGDIATFTVIHKGQRKEVELKLIPYEPETMASAKLNAIPVETDMFQGLGGNGQVFVAPGGDQWRGFSGTPLPQEDIDKIRGHVELSQKEVERLKKEYLDRAQEMSKDADARARDAQNRAEQQRRLRVDTDRNAQGSGGPRVQNLEERLDRLEKMIERLIEQRSNDNPPPPPGRGGGKGGPRMPERES